MTDKVLQEVRAEMRERGLTQLELAKRIAANNQYVNDILTGKRGTISKRWEDILDELGLELTVTPKTSASGAPYSGDPETDELLDDVELMASVQRYERGEATLIPWEHARAELNLD